MSNAEDVRLLNEDVRKILERLKAVEDALTTVHECNISEWNYPANITEYGPNKIIPRPE